MANKITIGTREMDKFFFMNHLMGEFDDEEYEDEIEMPKLRPSKIDYFDLKMNGNEHPLTEKILEWQAEMEEAGKYDDIPDNPKDVINMFEKGLLP